MGLFKTTASSNDRLREGQFPEIYSVPRGLRPTAAAVAAVPTSFGAGADLGRWGSIGVVSNGDVIELPAGFALVLMEQAGVTGFVTEPGIYVWDSEAPDWNRDFAEPGDRGPDALTPWERFRLVGRPSPEQQAYFVSVRDLANNRFGTSGDIRWHDHRLNIPVSASVRGTYAVRIVEPVLFVRNWVSAQTLEPGSAFDLSDSTNPAFRQLFHEVVGGLGEAFTRASDGGTQGVGAETSPDAARFSRHLSDVMEEAYQWTSIRGLAIVSASIAGLDYSDSTRSLLGSAAQGGHSPLGSRAEARPEPERPAGQDLVEQLSQYRRMLDGGLISPDEYTAAKARILDR